MPSTYVHIIKTINCLILTGINTTDLRLNPYSTNPNALIYTPYARVHCLKTIAFTAAHTYNYSPYTCMAVPPPGMERGTVRVKCLAQEHNTMAQSRIALLKVEHPNHEVSAPPKMK